MICSNLRSFMLRAQPPAGGKGRVREGLGESPGVREGSWTLTARELVLRCHRPLHHLRFDEAGTESVRIRGVMLGGRYGGERQSCRGADTLGWGGPAKAMPGSGTPPGGSTRPQIGQVGARGGSCPSVLSTSCLAPSPRDLSPAAPWGHREGLAISWAPDPTAPTTSALWSPGWGQGAVAAPSPPPAA